MVLWKETKNVSWDWSSVKKNHSLKKLNMSGLDLGRIQSRVVYRLSHVYKLIINSQQQKNTNSENGKNIFNQQMSMIIDSGKKKITQMDRTIYLFKNINLSIICLFENKISVINVFRNNIVSQRTIHINGETFKCLCSFQS